jgi:hypothetical protein
MKKYNVVISMYVVFVIGSLIWRYGNILLSMIAVVCLTFIVLSLDNNNKPKS